MSALHSHISILRSKTRAVFITAVSQRVHSLKSRIIFLSFSGRIREFVAHEATAQFRRNNRTTNASQGDQTALLPCSISRRIANLENPCLLRFVLAASQKFIALSVSPTCLWRITPFVNSDFHPQNFTLQRYTKNCEINQRSKSSARSVPGCYIITKCTYTDYCDEVAI